MRHLKAGRKLNRNPAHRRSLMRNMACALIEHGKIETTPAKVEESSARFIFLSPVVSK